METAKVNKLTQLIEAAESNLKALIDQYNNTVQQLQQLQQVAAQLKDDVISSKARYDALVEVNNIHKED